MTYATVTLVGPRGREEVELLVDTGSLYTWVSEKTLDRLGIAPTGTHTFRTIEGRELVKGIGEAVFELSGERATRIVVFAQEGEAQVLGVDSLEGLGFEVDPSTQRLKKTAVFLAY